LEQLSILIRIDAFRFTGKPKKELMWDAHFLLSKAKKTTPISTLFYEAAKEFVIPPLYAHALESAYDEIELVGFPVGISPFKLVEMNGEKQVPARRLPELVNRRVEVTGYLIHAKRTRTTNGKQMTFGTFIDYEGNWIDTVQFPEITARYPFRGPGCYKIKGKVISEFGFVSIETTELYRLTTINIEEPSTRLRVNEKKAVLVAK
jgi:DNA polymerase-3 subunit alpha